MAKIVRKTQKQFGSTAPSTQIGQFGSLAAGTPVTSTDPDTIQLLSNYSDGWYAAVLGPNAPAIEDMNALHFLFARQLAYLMQTGVAEWDTNTIYFIGSLVNDTTGLLYKSLTDNNTGNVLTSTTNWTLAKNKNVVTVTTTYLALISDDNIWGDATTGPFTITFPTGAYKGQEFTVKKIDFTFNALTIAVPGGQTIDINTITDGGTAITYVFDGSTSWQST